MTDYEKYLLAYKFTARWEGSIVNHTADKGGPTFYGVSLAFLKDLRKSKKGFELLCKHRIPVPINEESLTYVLPAIAEDIFYNWFWLRPRIYELPLAFAIPCFDYAVNSGDVRAIQHLQEVLNNREENLKCDGVIGKKTIEACERNICLAAIDAYLQRRRLYIERIVENNPSQHVFIRGWLNRVTDLIAYMKLLEKEKRL